MKTWQYKECDGDEIICEDKKCQTCCPHDDTDHGICLDCDYDEGYSTDWDWSND